MFFFPITKKGRARQKVARELYAACTLQSRLPHFYSRLAVPDSFDGRFEMTALHTGMIVTELAQRGGDEAKLAQALFDVMFVNMDLACRESGIGDLSVPKHLKRMMKAFKGRSLTYRAAMEEGSLRDALARNLYGTVTRPSDTILDTMALYVTALAASLASQHLIGGAVAFPSLTEAGEAHVPANQAA